MTETNTPTHQRDGERGAENDDAPPAEPTLRIADVRHTFGDVTVLDGLSLDVTPGSLVGVVGPNGSGKSTLLRAVAGVLRPDRGRVETAGDGVRPVGYLPQRPSFRAGFTVADTLGFYADLLGSDGSAADVDETLRRVGLLDASDRRVEALSGGMTRLLGLAQALLGDPSLLVLDEPASGLDPAISAHIFETIRDVVDEGRCVVLASHDLVAVERTADRVALLDRGRFVLDGSPDELVADAGAESLVDVFLDTVTTDDVVPTVQTGVDHEDRPGDGQR